jgi:hypothetical protein
LKRSAPWIKAAERALSQNNAARREPAEAPGWLEQKALGVQHCLPSSGSANPLFALNHLVQAAELRDAIISPEYAALNCAGSIHPMFTSDSGL